MKTINYRTFFGFVIPSVIAFALSGIYAIVDGFFVGNTIGDAGLSAINIAYPIVAVLQSVGTGIGMGGAVYYSIKAAEGDRKKSGEFVAASWWLLLISSVVLTVITFFTANPLLKILGAQGTVLEYGVEYVKIIAVGASLQILGTGLVPFIRNYGGSFWAMFAMLGGFVTNIVLDYLFVWVYEMKMTGAAVATIVGQGVTMIIAIVYSLVKKSFFLHVSKGGFKALCKDVFKVGLAPFGLSLTPNISLVLINRFSSTYGGEKAIATYACISYIICIIYLVLQGVGDGSQPLMSRCYGERKSKDLAKVQKMAYSFALVLALIGCAAMFFGRHHIGKLFGSSDEVNTEIAKIIPIFLISVPFVAVTRITTAGFYATEKAVLSYVLTFIEPILMLLFMLVLPKLFGGQRMIWWSTVFARIVSAVLAFILAERQRLSVM
ncbi:MAG: MATE family efflux transporter, partial [Clostridia bacterium]|nr:MATE family efflux transporter [Clostridia bacterium]